MDAFVNSARLDIFEFLEFIDNCAYFCTNKCTDMITTSLSNFRKDMKRYLDNVTKNFETVIINRGKDQGVVIISLEEYNSLTSTQYELSSKVNEQRLDSAIEKLQSGKSFEKKI
jgi:antitoxin YefM